MAHSSFDKALSDLDYWFERMEVVRRSRLAWDLVPNEKWPEEHSFGFHFSRDCLGYESGCRFKPIRNTAGYRLSFPAPIKNPMAHPHVLEAALWKKLTELPQ